MSPESEKPLGVMNAMHADNHQDIYLASENDAGLPVNLVQSNRPEIQINRIM